MTREYTKKLLDLIDEGVVDKDALILNLLNWMSEDFVKEFYEQYYESDEEDDKKGSIYIYTDDFEIIEIYPEYIKQPNKVWIGTYNSLDGQYTVGDAIVECDLPEHTHPEIIDLAVAECSRIIENPNFAQLKQQKLLINE